MKKKTKKNLWWDTLIDIKNRCWPMLRPSLALDLSSPAIQHRDTRS